MLPTSPFRLRLGLAVVLVVGSVLVSALLVGGARSAREPSGVIAFTRGDGIYVMRADGSGVRLLRSGGVVSRAFDLAWSRDGHRLAFVSPTAIWLMHADGTGLMRLVAGGSGPGGVSGWLASPTWAPDGRRLAFTAGHRYDRDIWVVNSDGSNLRRLAKTRGYRRDYNEVDVAWNPQGGRLAFSGAGWLTPITVIDANGSNLRARWGEGYGEAWAHPDWSPDGHQIVFDDQGDLSILNPDADNPWRHLTQGPAGDSEPVWSPDGQRVAFVRATAMFVRARRLVRPWRIERDRVRSTWIRVLQKPDLASEIYLVNTDGSGVTRLTHNRVGEGSPAWQPVASS